MSVKVKIETITPAMAQEFLKRAAKNRRISAKTVERYARDITRGAWHLVNNAIAFDDDGILLDGEHRLHAIIRSGRPIESLVMYGMTRAARGAVDSGRGRSISDQWRIDGRFSDFWNLSTLASAARAMMSEPNRNAGRHGLSHAEITEFVERHIEELVFAESCIRYGSNADKRGIYRAPVLALIARAVPYVGAEALTEFGSTLVTGVRTSRSEGVVLTYRDYLKSSGSGAVSGRVGTRAVYCVGQTALSAFVDERPLRVLRPTYTDLYPIET